MLDRRPPIVIHHARARETAPGAHMRRVDAVTPVTTAWSVDALELARHRLDLLHSPDDPPQGGARRQVITVHDLHFLHYPQFMTADSAITTTRSAGPCAAPITSWSIQRHARRPGQPAGRSRRQMTVTCYVDQDFRPAPGGIGPAGRGSVCRVLHPSLWNVRAAQNIPGLLDAYRLLRRDLPTRPRWCWWVGAAGWMTTFSSGSTR